MRIELRDERRSRVGRVDIDSTQRPTRVTVTRNPTGWRQFFGRGWLSFSGLFAGSKPASSHDDHVSGSREVFLTWDTALDDAGQLRRCVACGCPELFREKAFPQVTGFVVLLAFIGAIVGALGLATDLPVLLTMAGVLLLDIAILFFSRRRLVCYQCRSSFHDLPIARYHRPWDRSVADRYPGPPPVELQAPAGEVHLSQVQGARG
jgi:hypothetical protein